MRGVHLLLFLIGGLLAGAAHALDDRGAKAVVDKFLRSQKLDGASADAGQHFVTDLNGDGKPDIVLQWNVLGPTWWLTKLSVFIDQGGTYRTVTTDLTGQVEKVTVKGATIQIDTLTLGPKDARCCPSKKTRVVYRWANDKLALAR